MYLTHLTQGQFERPHTTHKTPQGQSGQTRWREKIICLSCSAFQRYIMHQANNLSVLSIGFFFFLVPDFPQNEEMTVSGGGLCICFCALCIPSTGIRKSEDTHTPEDKVKKKKKKKDTQCLPILHYALVSSFSFTAEPVKSCYCI